MHETKEITSMQKHYYI